MSDELKPVRCGCGGAANVETAPFVCYDELWGEPESQYVVWCNSCGIGTRVYNTKAEVIMAWNRAMGERTAVVTTVEKPVEGSSETITVVACGNCERPVSLFDKYCSGCGARLEWK